MDVPIWDNHTYIAPEPGTPTIAQLERHRRAGIRVAFLNLGDASRSFEHIVRMAAFCRRWISGNADRFIQLDTIAEAERAAREQKLAIGFDVEGMYSLGDRLDAISLYYDLGVRWMLFVYNRRNKVGSGVHDADDTGLTPFGREVAAEMDRVGMIKCLSHTGYRTAMDVLAASGKPCIFSHSNVLALKAHARNIPDSLLEACAATDGVIGISGLSIFLGSGAGSRRGAERMAEHMDYVAQRVGVDHVGLGLDYGYIGELRVEQLATDTDYWPPGNEYDSPIECVSPEMLGDVAECLRRKGYSGRDVAKIFGGNMARVAAAVWRPSGGA